MGDVKNSSNSSQNQQSTPKPTPDIQINIMSITLGGGLITAIAIIEIFL